jgi:thiol-disulfide isomerase/thioredoxin
MNREPAQLRSAGPAQGDLPPGRGWRGFLLAALLGLASLPALAVDWRPFVAGSPAALRARFANESFVLAFWSVNCAPCRDELADWPAWQRRFPGARVVFVNTDEPEDLSAAEQLVHKLKLGGAEHWNLADEIPERVRWAVLPSWRGELPFSLYYDRRHQPSAHYGRLDTTLAVRWLADTRGGRHE